MFGRSVSPEQEEMSPADVTLSTLSGKFTTKKKKMKRVSRKSPTSFKTNY